MNNKVASILFAVLSTAFLAVGATRAAEKFDALKSQSPKLALSQSRPEQPPLPCDVMETGSLSAQLALQGKIVQPPLPCDVLDPDQVARQVA